MTNLRIETIKISSLTPDPTNARRHDSRNLESIKGSLKLFGQRKPIVVTGANVIVAGNGTVEAAKDLGWSEILIVRTPIDWTPEQVKAYALADNRTAELAEWDSKILADQLIELDAVGWNVAEFGFEELNPPTNPELLESDEIPIAPIDAISKIGDVWILGNHRVMCGDSTNQEHVAKLTDGKKAVLLHADPPYGMGKEKDGVQNDNLYADKLDAFQMLWWKTWRKHLEDNASAYIWGKAEDLWRLWFVSGLKNYEKLTFRNQIVWSKYIHGKSKPTKIEMMRSYSNYTEHCLFFMLGEQGFNNNSDNYWEGWEPIRTYLNEQMEKCGGHKNWKDALQNQMGSHYFTKSQWTFPTKEAYKKLQDFGKGDAFKRDYDAFKRDYDALKRDYDALKKEFYGTRAYFDNTHENMTDVWICEPVATHERFGEHATPKPLELMQRVMKSSAPESGLVFEPFGGSGSTLIAAEQTNRICYTMELTPAYVDVIVKRWENLTGKTAERLDS
jgi:DNA modification methylase